MKFLRFLFVLFLFVNSHCYATSYSGNQEFATGEKYWQQSKLHYHGSVANQFREQHAQYAKMDFFPYVLELEQKNTLHAPINFTVKSVLDGINVNFEVYKGGVTQLQLFLAFNEALVEIFDAGSEIYTKAKYIRSDLNKAKDYFAQAVTFLNGVQHISQYIFKGVNNDFNEEKFIKSLNNASYIPAESIQSQLDSFIEDMKTKHQGIISIEQYIEFHTDLYSKLFTNQYFFLKAHLVSQAPKTRLNLNRKLTGGLNEFKCNLTTINLLKTIKPELQEENTTSNVQVGSNKSEPTKKHKKKRKKKRVQTQAKIMEVDQTTDQLSSNSSANTTSGVDTKDELPSISSTSRTTEANFQNNQKLDDPLSHEISEVPFIIGNLTLPEKSMVDSPLTTTSTSSQQDPLSEAPQIKEKKKEVLSQIERKEEVIHTTPKEQSHNVKQTISQMQKLNILLNEHDGGPTTGMKTRKFLRLCAALHENGFLYEFSANKKEVYVKVDSMASVMHVENHSANRKSPGVSRSTAKKLQEIIEIIKNSIE